MTVYIILGVVILMVIAMLSGKFDFGLPPIAACLILALTGVVTLQEAFSGFTNNYLLCTAAFLVISTAFAKTSVVGKIQKSVYKLQAKKSGYALYIALIVFIILLANFLQPGPAALMAVVLLSTIPEGDKSGIAPSQMLLPLGTLCDLGAGKAPIGMTLMVVIWENGFLKTAGYKGTVGLGQFILLGIAPLIVTIIYSLTAYRVLPKQSISHAEETVQEEQVKLSGFHEAVIYTVFAVCTVSLFFSNQLGNYVYMIPLAAVLVLIFTNAMTAKEVRSVLSMNLIFMLAGIFSIADIMANKGVSKVMAAGIQNVLGAHSSGWLIIFVFAFASVLMANLSGSNIGTMMIMSPIAITTAMAAGFDPRGIAIAIAAASTASVMMPMDTAMGIVFASGNYKLSSTFKYTVPLTILYITVVCVSAGLIYPF